MKSSIKQVTKIYLGSKDVDRMVENMRTHLFLNCTKTVDIKFMNSVTLTFLIELQSFLRLPKYNLKDSKYYNEDILYFKPLTEKQADLAVDAAEVINARLSVYDETAVIESPFQKVFEEYCDYIGPSMSRKGDIDYKVIQTNRDEIKRIKEENKEFFDKLYEETSKISCSHDLLIMVCKECFKLVRINDKNEYQFNLKNDDVIRILRKYCKLTKRENYADEYNKVSNIRSILTRMIIFVFRKDFNINNDGYCIRKFHSRLRFNAKISKREFLFSKSIYNHFITFNDLTYLLRKSVNHLSLHSIRKHTKVCNKIDNSNTLNNST